MVKFALHFCSVSLAVDLNTTERLTEDDEITASGIEVLGKAEMWAGSAHRGVGPRLV